MSKPLIDTDIKKAATLPSFYYTDSSLFLKFFQSMNQTWQVIGHESEFHSTVHPFIHLEDVFQQPLIRTCFENEISILSNVCTHRGNLIFHHECRSKRIACGYHGRQWKKDGGLKFMPEFNEVEDFPRACDHLKKYPTAKLGPHVFTSLNPGFPINKVFDKMNERIGFLPLDLFKYDSKHSKDYLVNCHWALYCDNYLEGFHIPFVHDDLNGVDKKSFKIETHVRCIYSL